MLPDRAAEPWTSFLKALDRALDQRVTLHCIGGFALAMLYGLPRPTIDVDCLAIIPDGATARVEELGGKGSRLHLESGVYLQHVGIVTPPENYAERLVAIMPSAFRRLSLFGLEAHDLALSKLERNSDAIGRTSATCSAPGGSISTCWTRGIAPNCDRTSPMADGTTSRSAYGVRCCP